LRLDTAGSLGTRDAVVSDPDDAADQLVQCFGVIAATVSLSTPDKYDHTIGSEVAHTATKSLPNLTSQRRAAPVAAQSISTRS
jgi:hypothetical protein